MMKLFQRRHVVVLVSGVVLVIFTVVLFVTTRNQETPGLNLSEGFLLTGLTLLNLLVLLALLFVLFRQLVKGYLEWRRQREGARLRTRLLTAFVVLGLLPSLLLFIGAIQMIESAADRWFRSPVHGVNIAGQRLVDHTLDLVKRETYRKAKAVVWQMEQVPIDLRPSLARHIFEGGNLDQLWVVNGRGEVLVNLPEKALPPDPDRISKLFEPGGLEGWIDLTGRPRVVSGLALDPTLAVSVASFLPEELFEEARFIAENNKQFLQIRSLRKTLKVTMISSFLALTLLVTFVAVWIGSHLTREISVPLQLLLEGTREVARGNLKHRIAYDSKDEIGMVVSSFNQMTEDMAESKQEIERSNLELLNTSQSAERARRYIETLLETLNIGVISTGAKGQIRTVNPRAREILGMERSEPARNVVSRPVWRVIKENLPDPEKLPILNREVVVSREAGQRILSISATKLKDPEGAEFGTLFILEDITDLSKAQRIAAWQEVARRMAHDIKNPLTPIRLSAQRIRKKFRENAEDVEEAILQGTTTIEREVEGMITIVNEFSRFARLPEIRPKPGDFPALIHEVLESYRAAYPKVALELEIPETFPPVRLDHEQMGRAFKNLVENALQAMKMSGTLKIRLQEIEGSAVCTLHDSGPGVPPDARSRLFLPYYSTKRRGTGLGLAIVARIVEEHGGRIQVDEEYAEGAGFILTLPLN